MTTTPHVLASGSFTQSWTNTTLIVADDDWSGVPSIVAYRGDDLTTSTGTDPQTILADGSGTPVDVNANQTAPDTFATGGIAEFHIADPTVALNGSGAADAPHIVLYMDSTGRQNVTLSFNARDIDGSADDAAQQLVVQYRVGSTGDFANVSGGYFADVTTGSAATLVTPVSVVLPAAANNRADLQIRIMTTNAVGNDEHVGIDDIVVASAAASTAPIHDIQGNGLTSPLAGATVTTSGIVTAIDTSGFYIQDAAADADPATSEGIFVFTGSAPTVALGDSVDVTGTVEEFVAPGAVAGTLTVTRARGQPDHIDVCRPATRCRRRSYCSPRKRSLTGLEKYEGMLVTVASPLVTGPTNTFGEIWVVPGNGAGSTGLNARGDILISAGAASFGNTDTVGGDFNPERIQIDPDLGQTIPDASVGATLNSVTGIVNYSFGNYEVLATAPVTVATASPLAKTGTTLTGDTTHLLLANYDAENLDPGDGAPRFATVANEIISRLNSPDVIALQNIQDNNGPTNDAVTSAALTLQMIVDAVSAAGGPSYAFLDNPFIGDDTSSGEPGGNIRTAYLFRTDHVSFVAGSLRTIGANGSAIAGGPDLTQQTDPNNPFFASRPPLAADFIFNGEVVTVVNVHFTSKGGSGVLAGSIQPPFDAGEVQRAAQAQAVNTFVDALLTANPNARVIVTGDLNEFGFEQPLDVLKGTASISGYAGNGSNPAISATATYTPGGTQVLGNLLDTLAAGERFNALLDGNAVAIGHILVSSGVAAGAQLQHVHINAEFFDQTGDHDPLVGRFAITDVTSPTVTINQGASQSDPTGTPPILFDIVFSEDVTGFDAGDITIGGTANPSTKSLTMIDAQHFTVAVGGMTASGTVVATIAAGVATDDNANPNLASTSIDNTVTIDLQPSPPNDFNNDDRSDMLWQNDNGTAGIWTMDGLNRIDGANVGFNPGPTWHVKAAGDFNADDHADILWQNDNGSAGVWLMDGFSVIGDGIVGFNPGPSWKVIGAGDFDADGHADILWQNDNGTAGIWTMDGLTRTGGANVGFNPGPSWHVKAAGDFNGDAHADILWQNDNGAAGIWLMDGFSVIGDGIVGFNPGPSWKVIDAGDFDADGKSDILWQNENGTPGIWTMDGLTRTGGANVGGFNPGPSWKVKTAGDYNGDGRSDILWQNDNGQPGIWLMDGFDVLADNCVGFNPGPTWHVVGQHDLIGG